MRTDYVGMAKVSLHDRGARPICGMCGCVSAYPQPEGITCPPSLPNRRGLLTLPHARAAMAA
jgi:hypothetical protein